jgi:hypothetical protein
MSVQARHDRRRRRGGRRDVGVVGAELWGNGRDLEQRERRHFKVQRKRMGVESRCDLFVDICLGYPLDTPIFPITFFFLKIEH